MYKALIEAIRDTLSLDTIKLALFTAIPIAALWIGIGYLFWEEIIAFTNTIISWIPFSIVKANGAFILTFFLWFVATLVSYALFIGLFSGFFLSQTKERRFEAINFFLILFFAIVWAVVLIFNWEYLSAKLEYFLTLLPFQTVSDTIAWLLGFYLLYNAFLLSQYFVVFLFRAPFITALMAQEHTPISLPVGRIFIKDMSLFILLTLLTIPLLFIPIANFLALWFVWAWLYKESAFTGTCALVCDEELFEKVQQERFTLLAISLLGAFLNFIPIISFFTPYFIFSFYLHFILRYKDALVS